MLTEMPSSPPARLPEAAGHFDEQARKGCLPISSQTGYQLLLGVLGLQRGNNSLPYTLGTGAFLCLHLRRMWCWQESDVQGQTEWRSAGGTNMPWSSATARCASPREIWWAANRLNGLRAHVPLYLRASLMRGFILRLGFPYGGPGFLFHSLQGFRKYQLANVTVGEGRQYIVEHGVDEFAQS